MTRRVEATSKLFNCHTEAKDNIEEAKSTHKKYYDAKHLPPCYKVGDKVLLNNARRKQRLGDKLTPRWTGPYVTGEIRAKGTFRLKGRKPLVNAKLIKPYLTACRRLSKSKTLPPPAAPSNSTASPPENELVRSQLMNLPLMSSLTVWMNNGKLPWQTPSNVKSGRI